MTVDLTELRNKFRKSGLSRSDLDDDPVKQFSLWFTEAIDSGIVEPTAMSLATSDESEIGLRTVLLKYFDDKGFVFYTNYESKKSRQIEKRPEAAILFPWVALDRQIKIIGGVEIGEGSVIKKGSKIKGPVIIGKNCVIEGYVGPYTSIGDNSNIKGGEIESSIIIGDVNINFSEKIVDSLIGKDVVIDSSKNNLPKGHRFILGEHSEVRI